jgi:hypothetical protein
LDLRAQARERAREQVRDVQARQARVQQLARVRREGRVQRLGRAQRGWQQLPRREVRVQQVRVQLRVQERQEQGAQEAWALEHRLRL